MEFSHSILDSASNSLRLFRMLPESDENTLRLTLTCHTVDGVLPDGLRSLEYTALSYMWASPEPLHLILVNGLHCHIRTNLYSFLRQLRASSQYGPSWADALCINQEDLAERNDQVAIMGTVYESAAAIAAWIGPETDYAIELFHAVNETQHIGRISEYGYVTSLERAKYKRRHGSLHEYHSSTIRDSYALARLCEEEYFNRTWIVQELRISEAPMTIWCGANSTTSDLLKSFHRAAMGRLLSAAEEGENYAPQWMTLWDILDDFHLRIWEKSHSSILSTLISHHAKSQCSDPRDKIYALRSLATDINGKTLRPRYEMDIEDLFWEVLDHITGRYTLDLSDTSERPIWKLLSEALGVSVQSLRIHLQKQLEGASVLDRLSRNYFSQKLSYVGHVLQIERNCTHLGGDCAEPEAAYHTHPGRCFKTDRFEGITHGDVQTGDVLWRLKTGCELHILGRHSTEDNRFVAVGWAVALCRFNMNDYSRRHGWESYDKTSKPAFWCYTKSSMWIQLVDSVPDPIEWLCAKFSLALQSLQQLCDALQEGAVLNNESPHSAVLTLSPMALLALWEYSEHPSRSS